MIQIPIKKFIFLSPQNVRVFDISFFLKKISHIVKIGIYIDLQFLLSDMSSKIVNFVTWSKVWVDLSTSLLIWGNSLFLSSVRLLSWCIVKYSSSYRISVISLMRSFTHQKKEEKEEGVQNSSKSSYDEIQKNF